jgi:hypothetical protein
MEVYALSKYLMVVRNEIASLSKTLTKLPALHHTLSEPEPHGECETVSQYCRQQLHTHRYLDLNAPHCEHPGIQNDQTPQQIPATRITKKKEYGIWAFSARGPT